MRLFDADGNFAPPIPQGGSALRRMAVRGAGATILSGAIGLAIQMGSVVVLGRLLTPRDFGLVTMVTTFSLLLVNGTANGFIDATLQRQDVTSRLASTMFWINLGFASFLTLLFIAASPLIARFYGEPPVQGITAGMAATIFLTNMSIIHAALLRKAMRFSALGKNDIVGRAVGVATSICFAFAGWGYWSLVMGACASALSISIGIWILCPWMPGPPRRKTGAKETLIFASHISGRYCVNYFARNFDNLLVGWRFGAYALGFYKKAYDLFALSASQLVAATSNVAVSALSRVRDDRPQFLRFLLGAVGVMSLIGMGLAGDLTLVGKDLIRVLLGPGWETAGTIFVYFAPGIGMMMVYYIHGWIHVSIGRADRWFIWGIVEWTFTVTLFLVCLHWGPQGIAIAWCVSFWILTLPSMAYAGKPIGLGVGPVLDVVWRYLGASLAASLATYFLMQHVPGLAALQGTGGAALRLVCVSIVFSVLYMAGIVVLHGGTAPLRKMIKLLRDMKSSKSQPEAAKATEASAG